MKPIKRFSSCCLCVSRGDDLGGLTETDWPDVYKPEQGLGDLTGKITKGYGMKLIPVLTVELLDTL
jgi:hypothetical protein